MSIDKSIGYSTIDIDIGGTFTDCLAIINGNLIRSKTPTTTYNLSVGFQNAIREIADQVDMDIEDLVPNLNMIRYSTTVAMNSLIERKGPKLGLITTAGFEDTLKIGRARVWSDGLHPKQWRDMSKIIKPEPLIPRDMVVGVRERVDYSGNEIMPIDPQEIREKIQYLVDKGAKGFVISLLWSFKNPAHERVIRDLILEEYPENYLGRMPIHLSSEVQPKWHEYTRTNVTLLNAYLQGKLTDELSGLGDELQQYGYKKPLQVINNLGGMAKVSRTRSVDTFGAGPVAGLFGAAFVAKNYDIKNVIVSDMGGTSFDLGLVVDGEIRTYSDWPVIDRWATENLMIDIKTIGAGGGSIAWINQLLGNRLEVGPQSAGANPGPVCYDLGSTEPAVTDADLVLGYLNPDNFLGGAMRLDKEKAVQAIQEKIAKPLGISVEEAALGIRRIVDANMGDFIAKEIMLEGHSPDKFVLFAYGGAGPAHCCDYANHLGLKKILTFPFASVFCALGGATMDVRHVYEKSQHILAYNGETKAMFTDFKHFNDVVEELKQKAIKDILGEGFPQEQINFQLELDMRYGMQTYQVRVPSPVLTLNNEDQVKAIIDAFTKEYIRLYTEISVYSEGGIEIESFYLIASVPLRKPVFPVCDFVSEDPTPAQTGTRPAVWEKYDSLVDTPVYDVNLLACGNVINGPAIIESKDTTYVITPGWEYRVDKYLNGILTKLD